MLRCFAPRIITTPPPSAPRGVPHLARACRAGFPALAFLADPVGVVEFVIGDVLPASKRVSYENNEEWSDEEQSSGQQ